FAIRQVTKQETRRNRPYVDHRIGPGSRHLSKTKSALVFSVYVGAQTRDEALNLARDIPDMMTGFDLAARPVTVSHVNRKAAKWLGVAIAVAAATVAAESMFDTMPEHVVNFGWLATGLLTLLSLLGFVFGPP